MLSKSSWHTHVLRCWCWCRPHPQTGRCTSSSRLQGQRLNQVRMHQRCRQRNTSSINTSADAPLCSLYQRLPCHASSLNNARAEAPMNSPHQRRQCNTSSVSGSGDAHTAVTEATQRWIDSMVVGLGLCPFTKPLRNRPHSLRTRHSFATIDEELVQCVDEELQLLQPGITGPNGFTKHPSAPTPETTLLVIAPWDGNYTDPDYYLTDFRAFLNAAWLVEDRICVSGLGDHIQLACFHPQAVFNTYADLAPTTEPGEYYDPAQFAIRSPYPTFHFLRAQDIAAAVDQAPSAANIPDVNKRRLRDLGPAHARALFEDLL